MTNPAIAIETLEEVNDIIAEAIDAAGADSELLLAKTLFHLTLHAATPEELRRSVSISLRDLSEPKS